MNANTERGGVPITLAGKTYTMMPTFKSVIEIEERTGLSILELAKRLAKGQGGMTHHVAVIAAGVRASGESADYDNLGQMVFAEGLDKVALPVLLFLTRALNGGA